MLESSKNNDRAKFPSKEIQTAWFKLLLENISVSAIASCCKCSERTVRDWSRGKFMPPYECVRKVSTKYNVNKPNVERVSRSSIARKSGSLGGKATISKYGVVPVLEEERKAGWVKWWNEVGKYDKKRVTSARSITTPEKTENLAEFVGIMIGDGTISNYHIAISLDTARDKEYIIFVIKLIKQLFGVTPKIYPHKERSVTSIVIARVQVVRFLQTLGLPVGSKLAAGISIPDWIMSKTSYKRSCVRGLFDTDGSVYIHSYTSKGRIYRYLKIGFTSASPTILNQVQDILSSLDIGSRVIGSDVKIEKQSEVSKYLDIIGTSNTKFLKRLNK